VPLLADSHLVSGDSGSGARSPDDFVQAAGGTARYLHNCPVGGRWPTAYAGASRLLGGRTLVETVVPDCAVAASDRDRLARLLALVSPTRRWAVEHRHAPLLCALGILDAPDVAYANASRRRFADPSETRVRALALIDELKRETRAERYEERCTPRPRLWAGVRPH
jgi:hypothetical protein